MSVGAAAAEAAAALQRPREEERVKKKILLPEKTSVKERKNERKRERTDISKVPHRADIIWVRFVFYMTNKFIMNIVL